MHLLVLSGGRSRLLLLRRCSRRRLGRPCPARRRRVGRERVGDVRRRRSCRDSVRLPARLYERRLGETACSRARPRRSSCAQLRARCCCRCCIASGATDGGAFPDRRRPRRESALLLPRSHPCATAFGLTGCHTAPRGAPAPSAGPVTRSQLGLVRSRRGLGARSSFPRLEPLPSDSAPCSLVCRVAHRRDRIVARAPICPVSESVRRPSLAS